jgi:hypothetical protein
MKRSWSVCEEGPRGVRAGLHDAQLFWERKADGKGDRCPKLETSANFSTVWEAILRGPMRLKAFLLGVSSFQLISLITNLL